jgi:hypothetical protein
MHTLDFNIGETNNFLRSDLFSTRTLSSTSTKEERGKSITESAVDSLMKNLSHAGVQSIVVVKRMYVNFIIQVRNFSHLFCIGTRSHNHYAHQIGAVP